MNNEKAEYYIGYKIMPGVKYRVHREEFKNYVFYKIKVKQKNYDGTSLIFDKDISFKGDVNIPNDAEIIIKTAYENMRENKNDKYHPLSYLLITDYILVEDQEREIKQAYDNFNNRNGEVAKTEEEYNPFEKFNEPAVVADEDLPF